LVKYRLGGCIDDDDDDVDNESPPGMECAGDMSCEEGTADDILDSLGNGQFLMLLLDVAGPIGDGEARRHAPLAATPTLDCGRILRGNSPLARFEPSPLFGVCAW